MMKTTHASWLAALGLLLLLRCGGTPLPELPPGLDAAPESDGPSGAAGEGGQGGAPSGDGGVPAAGGAGGSGGSAGSGAGGAGTGGTGRDAGVIPRDAGTDQARPGDAAAPTCGSGGQRACPDNTCASGGCVNADGICVAVGVTCGQRSGGTCNVDGSCGTGAALCGGNNQMCCRDTGGGPAAERQFCSAPGTTCAVMPAGDTKCVTCGGLGEPCCGGAFCRTGTCRREDGVRFNCR
jgi:hypothetical protein